MAIGERLLAASTDSIGTKPMVARPRGALRNCGAEAHIHRVEIPYGRFERRIEVALDDPYAPLELAGKSLENGVLTLTFRTRKEGA